MSKKLIPRHVAIIMDGNGRWANKRLMPRNFGHRQGAKNIKRIAKHASKLGIEVLTLYAFSTENWNRPEEEVQYLMKLPQEFFDSFLPEAVENNIRIETIGHIDKLPKQVQEAISEAKGRTSQCDGLILNFAINYGARSDLVQAVNQLLQLKVEEINMDQLAQHLSTHVLEDRQDPDLIIRTSGELRLSNFLLWEAAYSEFYFTDIYWPDFNERALDQAIESYTLRHRRYGKL